MEIWIAAVIGALMGAAAVTPQGRKMRLGRAAIGMAIALVANDVLIVPMMREVALTLGAEQLAAGDDIDTAGILRGTRIVQVAQIALVAGIAAALLARGGRHPQGRAGEIEDEERLRAEARERIARDRDRG